MKEDIIIALMIKKINNIYLFNKKDKSLRLVICDLLLKPSKNKLKSCNDSLINNEFNNNFESDENNKRLSSIKRKRLSSFNKRLK